MPELTEVETPKNAGFVQNKSALKANQKRIEQDEAELKSLMEEREANSKQEETTETKEANTEAEEETLSAEERTYKKRYSDLRKHLNKQSEEIKELKAQMENASSEDVTSTPKSNEEIEAWSKKYPEDAAIVESIATSRSRRKADKEASRDRKNLIHKLNAIKSENAIRKMHPDFDELRESDDFHNWAKNNPSGYRMPCTKIKMILDQLYVLLTCLRLITVWTSSLQKEQLKKPHHKLRQREQLRLTVKVFQERF